MIKALAVIFGAIIFACVIYRGESNIKANHEEIEKEINEILGKK